MDSHPEEYDFLWKIGKSFERMVERREELRKSPDVISVEKRSILSVIDLIITESINLGFRTNADWEEHSKRMKLAESDSVIDWAIEPA
jgi:hypothetical protein